MRDRSSARQALRDIPRLSDAAATFETSHPRVATAIERLADTLALCNL